MREVSGWLRDNHLKFNASKTYVLCHSNATIPTAVSTELFACLDISESFRAQSVHNLGVELDAS